MPARWQGSKVSVGPTRSLPGIDVTWNKKDVNKSKSFRRL